MTNEEFKKIVKDAKPFADRYEIDYEALKEDLKTIYHCIGCKWNDGLPHSACYSCNE